MAKDTWDALVDAHARAGGAGNGNVANHEPIAAVLSCSDARVPPSVLFDQPAGTLFVVRLAGNTASPAALASLDYAAAALGVDLIIVLGHTDCGAVAAAASGTCGGDLGPIVAPICEVARAMPGASLDAIVRENVSRTVDALFDHPGPSGAAARDGRLKIRGAVHDLQSGKLETVESTSIAADQPNFPLPTAAPMEAS